MNASNIFGSDGQRSLKKGTWYVILIVVAIITTSLAFFIDWLLDLFYLPHDPRPGDRFSFYWIIIPAAIIILGRAWYKYWAKDSYIRSLEMRIDELESVLYNGPKSNKTDDRPRRHRVQNLGTRTKKDVRAFSNGGPRSVAIQAELEKEREQREADLKRLAELEETVNTLTGTIAAMTKKQNFEIKGFDSLRGGKPLP